MDIEQLEALALSDDRSPALATLVAGSEEHDYWRALDLQHRGALVEVDAILAAWLTRHGNTTLRQRLDRRQRLLLAGLDLDRHADALINELGVSVYHQPDSGESVAGFPGHVDPALYAEQPLIDAALARSRDLDGVTADGLPHLIHRALDSQRRRQLLERLVTPLPGTVALIAADLDERNSRGFGSLALHDRLTSDELRELARLRPALATEPAWLAAVLRRLRPAEPIDWHDDLGARIAYLDALWQQVAPLPVVFAPLQAHILYHRLACDLRRERFDRARLRAYLALPRAGASASRTVAARFATTPLVALDSNLLAATDLPVAGDDEPLVRAYVHALLAVEPLADLADVLDPRWLEHQRAEVALLAGDPDPRWATLLGPDPTAALRERVDLELLPSNPVRFGRTGTVALDVVVKHVPTLRIRVFRIDTAAYFHARSADVDIGLDLDGLAAGWEEVRELDAAPMRRQRLHLELTACDRPGTYVVELIGAGKASRALVRRGELRAGARPAVGGTMVDVVDETGRACPTASLWMGGRAYPANRAGAIALPFSTRPGWTPVLLVDGDLAVASHVELRGESYALRAAWLLDRQGLLPGVDAVALVRLDLTLGGVPVSAAVLEEPYVEIVTTDRRGVSAQHRQPVSLHDDRDLDVRFPIPPDLAQLGLTLGGRVRVVSEQRTLDLRHDETLEVGTMHAGHATAAFHLIPGPDGHRLALLGKTGEPRVGRPVTISLTHRAVTSTVDTTAVTDARGQIGLGPLTGITCVHAYVDDLDQRFDVGSLAPIAPTRIVARAHTTVVVPTPTDRSNGPLAAAAWSLRELRAGVPARDVGAQVHAEAGRLIVRDLGPGSYELRVDGVVHSLTIVAADGPDARGWVASPDGLLELSGARTTSAAVAVTADAVVITVADPGPWTRVHLIATALAPAPAWDPRLATTSRHPLTRPGRLGRATYVSGRDIGDEYRYVLDRQRAPRRAGVLLDKPSLLLNPWALRATRTTTADARLGASFAGAPPAAPARSASAPSLQRRVGQASDPAFTAYDFLAAPPVVLANLVPDPDGRIVVARARLGGASHVHVVCVDPTATTHHRVALAAPALAVHDLRLAAPLPLDQHVREDRRLAGLPAGTAITLGDRATSRLELVDTVAKLYRALCALSGDPTLAAWDFLPRWASLPLAERQTLYSKHACHELALFIHQKDRPLFDHVLRPYLASKLHPTFLDHWLLDADLSPYLTPWRLARLNALELALLARRLPAVAPLVHRRLADAVELIVPNPGADDRLVDTFIAGGVLGGDGTGDALAAAAPAAEMMADGPRGGFGGYDRRESEESKAAPAPKMAKESSRKKSAGRARAADEQLDDEFSAREQAAPLYRSADQTQEWAEHNWWHQRVEAVGPDLIPIARLWRDLAGHRDGRFLSPHVADAATSFTAAMAALAVIDLPFTAAAHTIVARGAGADVTAGSDALAAVVELATVPGPPVDQVLVGQSYFRADDRWTWDGAEQVEKYVGGELLTTIVYACQVVVTNPTSRTQRVSVLHQIPSGAIAVGGAIATATTRLQLDPYQSQTFEYAFYFPHPFTAEHHGAEVTRTSGAEPLLLAAVAPRRLTVVATAREIDITSWPHLARHGSLDDVCRFLGERNLARIDLDAIAWRAQDRSAFARLTDTLAARGHYHDTLWGYALRHRDRPRAREWLAVRGLDLGDLGPVLATDLVVIEPVERARYQHLEYAPLINARAHRLGDRRTILNDGLAAQWRAFLDVTAHRPRPRSEDWLAAAHYLFAMDRPDDATRALARADLGPGVRISPGSDVVSIGAARGPLTTATAADLQTAYLHAYAAIVAGDLAAARARLGAHVDHPVDRWRTRFAALAALIDEASGGPAVTIADPDSRDRVLAAAAAAEPTLTAAVDRHELVIDHSALTHASLRFYRMDLELLFSRQPFFGGDTSRFGFIEPNLVQHLDLPARGPTRIPLPPNLRQTSVVIELVAGALRHTTTHFAHELTIAVTAPYGTLQVRHATTGLPRIAAYVKAYARQRNGTVAFYKDGYTDLCGRFDYATLSTDDLDRVDRFALLIADDHAGATVLEAAPPTR